MKVKELVESISYDTVGPHGDTLKDAIDLSFATLWSEMEGYLSNSGWGGTAISDEDWPEIAVKYFIDSVFVDLDEGGHLDPFKTEYDELIGSYIEPIANRLYELGSNETAPKMGRKTKKNIEYAVRAYRKRGRKPGIKGILKKLPESVMKKVLSKWRPSDTQIERLAAQKALDRDNLFEKYPLSDFVPQKSKKELDDLWKLVEKRLKEIGAFNEGKLDRFED